MPATIVIYNKPVIENLETVALLPSTNFISYKLKFYDTKECTKQIGAGFTQAYAHNFDADSAQYGNTFIKFFENSDLPYGDDNILVLSGTFFNKYSQNGSVDGTYTHQVNSALSSGEYSGQVGYAQTVKKNGSNDATTINFPLPTVTYTNAFNSLPQPSTAPLPA